MTDRRWIGRGLTALLFVLVILALLPPWKALSSGEVDLKQYVSHEVIEVGSQVVFGTKDLPVTGAVVRWNFGDGSPEVTGWPVTHTYTAAGEYKVTAVITYQSTGAVVPTIATRIRVQATTGNTPPQAHAEVSPRQILAGESITFDATASKDPDGQISRTLWNFGDNSTSNEPKGQHAYAQPGTYTIILMVTDNGEMDATAIVSVTVAALPIDLFPGINRAMPKSAGSPPELAPLVLVDMGIWETGRLRIYNEYSLPLTPPFRGVATSNRDWLVLDPAEFQRITGTAVILVEGISVRDTSLLPRAHTSWGMATLVINGQVMEMPVAITVRGPDRDISQDVWTLYGEVLDYLTDKGQRGAMAYSPRYGNGADFALGLVTEYVLEEGYGGKLPRQDFVTKVAELLMDRDENGDGVIGFTDQDRGLGIKVGR